MAQAQNTFSKGFNMDMSDFILPNDMLRNCENMRIIDLDGSTFARTSIPGNTNSITPERPNGEEFTLTDGYIPVAAKENNGILYIVSALFGSGDDVVIELGTYPSPNYDNLTDVNDDIWKYRPLHNLEGTDFRTAILFKFSPNTFVDLEIQNKSDSSVNYIITIDDNNPRLINSGFSLEDNLFTILDVQFHYTIANLLKETALIPTFASFPIVNYENIIDGGILKPGNYHYMFAYVDAELNETDIAAQSNTCAVMFGDGENYYKGGDENERTNKLVKLQIQSLDINFKYLQVYFKYSSGKDSEYTALFRINVPISISGETMTFVHTGYEDVTEVTSESINVDYMTIDSAAVECQVKNYLFLGNISQSNKNWDKYGVAAKQLIVEVVEGDVYNYGNPSYVYNTISERRGETIPYGVIFLMNSGRRSPVFPITGMDFTKADPLTETSTGMIDKGLVRFPEVIDAPFVTDVTFKALGLKVTLSDITDTEVIDDCSGLILVRGTRIEDCIAQGYMIPTVRVPVALSSDTNYYDDNGALVNNFKSIPVLDGLVEAYKYYNDYYGDDSETYYARGADGSFGRHMPCVIINERAGYQGGGGAGWNIYDETKWAFYSSEAIQNEPEYISKLNRRTSLHIRQYGKVQFNGTQAVTPVMEPRREISDVCHGPNDETGQIGLNYVATNMLMHATNDYIAAIECSFIAGEVDPPVNGFSSKANYVMRDGLSDKDCNTSAVNPTDSKSYYVSNAYNPYFGIDISVDGTLFQSNPAPDHPIGASTREPDETIITGRNGDITIGDNDVDLRGQINGKTYDNKSALINAAFIVNIYGSSYGINPNPDILYSSTDAITYYQATQPLLWNQDIHLCFCGDTYIGITNVRINLPGPDYRDANLPNTDYKNIDMGVLMELKQESKYNPHMRIPYQYSNEELEERTFFPFRDSSQNINLYRNYRYPDTTRVTMGSRDLYSSKGHYTISEFSPYTKFNFFTRIAHSERDVPNAIANNYRIFEGNSYRDYDTAVGKIVRLVEYRDNIIVVFINGIAIAPIEQRTQTGSDELGGVYVEPSSVLPPNLSFHTKDLGCQTPYSVVRTPQAVYGIDVARKKIWQITDKLRVISDDGFSSFLLNNMLDNADKHEIFSGNDPKSSEVFFTYRDFDGHDNMINSWTLVYTEGINQFSYFYTHYPTFYAKRSNMFYSFGNTDEVNLKSPHLAFKHNNYGNYKICNVDKECFVEFLINENPNMTKVIDSLKIISNEVAPERLELFTFTKDSIKESVITPSKCFQYINIVQAVDEFTEELAFRLRDRNYVVQVPTVQQMPNGDPVEDWGIDSRLRNKIVVVRVTYSGIENIELLSVITNYRRSVS